MKRLFIIIITLFMPIFAQAETLPAVPLSDTSPGALAAEAARQAAENVHLYKNLAERLHVLRGLDDRSTFNDQALVAGVKPFAPPDNPGQQSQLIVFLSLSMPEESIKGWLRETSAAGGVVVLRGFYQNKLSATLTRIAEIRGDDDFFEGMQIDPSSFRRLEINNVPAVAVLSEPLGPCTNEGCVGDSAPEHDRIFGNISLEAALEIIVKAGGVSSSLADDYLSNLREVL